MEEKYRQSVEKHIEMMREAVVRAKESGEATLDEQRHMEAVAKTVEMLAEVADMHMEFNSYNKDQRLTLSTMIEVTCGSLCLMLCDHQNKLPYFGIFGAITKELIHAQSMVSMVLNVLRENCLKAPKASKGGLNS